MKKTPKQYKNFGRTAFSLVELLFATAIIALLIVLCSFVFGKIRLCALATHNVSNHRKISSALLAYATENEGRLPYAYEEPKTTYTRTLAKLGYVTDGRIFFSPLSEKWYVRQSNLSKPANEAVIPWFYTNYGGNRYGAMPYNEGNYIRASVPKIGNDGNLSKLMLIRDTYVADYDKGDHSFGGGIIWFNGAGNLPPQEKTYNGIVHASYCDGHIEAFKREDYISQFKSGDTSKAPFFQKIYTLK